MRLASVRVPRSRGCCCGRELREVMLAAVIADFKDGPLIRSSPVD